MLLWGGQVVSTLGSSATSIVYPLLILSLTDSPAAAGFASALRAAPYLIFSLPVGALIDRWDRKRTMILCDAGRARKRVTSLRIVFPAAVSGIVAALIVGFSRAVGETMIVALAAGGVGGAIFTVNPCLPGQTMTAAMTALAVGSDQAGGGLAYASLFFIGLLLFGMTLALNLVSERFVRRIRSAY